jgi:hypothetical protein
MRKVISASVVVLIWVRFNLNPHPFKTKRVRHPKAYEGLDLAGMRHAVMRPARCWALIVLHLNPAIWEAIAGTGSNRTIGARYEGAGKK